MTDTADPREAAVAIPFAEQRQRAREHYDRISTAAGEWSSFVRDAIEAATEPSAGVTSEAATVRISELARAVGTLSDGDVIVRREGAFVRWESVLARLPSTSTETPTRDDGGGLRAIDVREELTRMSAAAGWDGDYNAGWQSAIGALHQWLDTAATTPVPSVSDEGLRVALEQTRAELDGCRRWFAFAVAASGGIAISDKALMLDAPAIEKSYDPVTNTTTFRALSSEPVR